MDNLVNETNARLQEIIDNLTSIKEEYENKLSINAKEIEKELESVKKYKEDFFTSKEKIEKMNSDIEGFEQDYQNLVDRFKDDELANILIAANKEISLKIDERKRKIMNDKAAMNELVEKAEVVKKKLVKLTAEKKALEICLDKILDAYNYYVDSLKGIIEYSTINRGNLSNKKESVATEDIKLDDEEYNIDSMKEASKDNFIVEEKEDTKDEIIIEDETDDEVSQDNNVEPKDNNDFKITLEEIKDDKEDTEEVKDDIKEADKIEDTDHVTEIAEIPSSIFNFDDVIGFDDEIEDDE